MDRTTTDETITIKDLLQSGKIGRSYQVSGWVRNKRGSKSVTFIVINDGSCFRDLQVIVEFTSDQESLLRDIHTGTALTISGILMESQGGGQSVELFSKTVSLIGKINPETYPIQPKKHTLDFLRKNAHLRFRTKTFSSIFRIRHGLSFAIHKFFNDRNFYYINTPIITSADAEGAGEMFKVTTFDLKNIPMENGEVDYTKDFFSKPSNLTVSGQLEAELAAMGLSKVYTFGPTFRAENSNTSRHLSEFWMIEPEVAFSTLRDNIKLATDLLKYSCQYILEEYSEDVKFLSERKEKEEQSLKKEDRSPNNLLTSIKNIIDIEFIVLSYTEAFDILRNSKKNKKNKFEFPINNWGVDFQSEHERFLVEKKFDGKPIIITDYPKTIKAFYMRLNDDQKTVRAMDILFPGIGEIIGGSQREERLEILERRMEEMLIPKEELWWYLDTRRFGSVPHSGFGLGFERLVQFVTGMNNIRDVIPFPRFPSHIEF